jgi:uncharacterized membrane protein YebE (DUF533 family)
MLHDLVVWSWVIGFASATVVAIGIASYKNYKEYVEQRQQRHNALYDKGSKQTEIEKWKRKVFRP